MSRKTHDIEPILPVSTGDECAKAQELVYLVYKTFKVSKIAPDASECIGILDDVARLSRDMLCTASHGSKAYRALMAIDYAITAVAAQLAKTELS
jgi:hypothetical protein